MITLKKTKSIQSSFQETKELALSLDSVDVFSSEDERKFAYLKIKNNRYSTCFFFVLKIDEYNASGTLLREGKLFFPNIYLPNGDTIENEYPFELDGDTESISICLVSAEYDGVHYYKDKLSSVLTKEMILETRALSACKDVKKELKEKTPELVDEPVPETEPEEKSDSVEEA